jgi:hypothetical protein
MNTSVVPQQVKAFLLGAVGLLIAIFLGMQIGDANYLPLLFGAAVIAVIFVSFYSGRFFWVLTIASSFLAGTFPILGGSFTPFQVLMVIGVAKFLIEDVVLRRIRIRIPNRVDALLIAGFIGILTWHGVHDRFGMKFLGSTVWGGRNYVNVYVGLAAFFIIQSIPVKPKTWAKLPYVVLAVTTFDLSVSIITRIFPSSIYAIYPFYSAVSTAGISELFTGEPGITDRVGAFGDFGVLLIILVLALTSLRKILHPANFFRLVTLGIGSIAVLYSGFRTAIFNSFAVILSAGVRDLKFKVLALLPLVGLFLFGLAIINSEFVRLPKQVQRSLAFLPGNWDARMVGDVAASNDFRMTIWNLWLSEYFPRQPLLGRGFGFKSENAQASRVDPKAVDFQLAVEVGNIHNGFLSTLDSFGIVGTLFFVIWNVRLLVQTFQLPSSEKDPAGMALRFLALYLAGWIVCYWMGASNVGTFLPREFAVAAVFLRLKSDLGENIRRAKPTPETDERKIQQQLVPV